MDLLTAHGRAMGQFDAAVRRITDDDWDRPTPCTEWSVRDLLDHLVTEQLWVPPLLSGRTIDEVGDRLDGDQLGEDPVGRWTGSARTARDAWLEPGVPERTVHLSYGDESARDYGWQQTVDLAVHAWDLATGLGVPSSIDDELANALITEFEEKLRLWDGTGLFAARRPVPADAGPHARLLGLVGREAG